MFSIFVARSSHSESVKTLYFTNVSFSSLRKMGHVTLTTPPLHDTFSDVCQLSHTTQILPQNAVSKVTPLSSTAV